MKSSEHNTQFVAGVMLVPLVAALVLTAGLMTPGGTSRGPGAVQTAWGSSVAPAQPAQSVGGVPAAQSAGDGQTIFQAKCAACHTIGGGKLVGPDLQGVTTRRDKAWLTRWIKEPDKMLAEGDPTATQLLQEFNNVPMPNLGLTDQQAEAIIAYLSTVGATAQAAPKGLPALYVPTLVVSVVALLALTALGLTMGKKRVEVRV